MTAIEPTLQMWLVFGIVGIAIIIYATERVSIELTSLATVAALLAVFHFLPLPVENGYPVTDARTLLAGLADPALITVLSLMVIGQGMVRTGVLDQPARLLAIFRRRHPVVTLTIALVAVMVISGFLNNTPVVVIFIPIMIALADRMRRSPSSLMIPLSFAAILGGMTTLIGSSTNLLISSAAVQADQSPLSFFEFSHIGILLAGIGIVYVVVVAPRLLPDRASMAAELVGEGEGKQFIAQIDVREGSALVGETARMGMFASLPEITVRLIQRGEIPFLPPFDEVVLQPGDELIVATTRKALTDVIARNPDLLMALHAAHDLPEDEVTSGPNRDFVLTEAVVAPASRIIGRNLSQIVFHHRTRCTVLGIQRRSRMIRQTMNDIRLEAGDVLLVLGHRKDVRRLRLNPDVIVQEWSARDLPAIQLAGRAGAIFLGVIICASTGLLPTVLAAVLGAAAMIGTGCLNIHQATRAMDRRVAFLVWAALAMGAGLHGTGGAVFIADQLMGALTGSPPWAILSIFFLLVAVMTNVLSNNATAVLFTPIGIGLASQMGIGAEVFIYATLFAANCSFATPMGYQTNLLVMGPGHYRFGDYMRSGVPLIIIIWLSFSIIAPFFYPELQ